MKYALILLTSFFFASCGNDRSQSVLTEGDYEAVKNVITVLSPKAYDEQDTVLLGQILHDNYQLIDDGGSRFNKAYEMEYVSKYGSSYDSYALEIKRLDLFDNGTAIVSGEGTIKGIDILNRAYVSSYQSTDVLIKENGNWVIISSHVSGVKEEVYENAPTE